MLLFDFFHAVATSSGWPWILRAALFVRTGGHASTAPAAAPTTPIAAPVRGAGLAADGNRDGDRDPDAMGKAMAHIAVVFAELERDFIRGYAVSTVSETGPRWSSADQDQRQAMW